MIAPASLSDNAHEPADVQSGCTDPLRIPVFSTGQEPSRPCPGATSSRVYGLANGRPSEESTSRVRWHRTRWKHRAPRPGSNPEFKRLREGVRGCRRAMEGYGSPKLSGVGDTGPPIVDVIRPSRPFSSSRQRFLHRDGSKKRGTGAVWNFLLRSMAW